MAVLCLRTVCVTKQVVSVVRSKVHFHREHRRTESTQTVATETTENTGGESAQAMFTKDLHVNCP
jgi:hypothetical protein